MKPPGYLPISIPLEKLSDCVVVAASLLAVADVVAAPETKENNIGSYSNCFSKEKM